MRPYRDEDDFWCIRTFLRHVLPLNGFREKCWHVVRWDYWRWHGVENLEHTCLPENVFLWETPSGEIAAVLNPEGKGEAFLQVHPGFSTPPLLEDMIIVAEQRLCVAGQDGRCRLRVWVEEHDCICQDIVSRRGYAKCHGPEYMRQRPIDMPILDAAPAPGYCVRALGDGAELLERCYASGLGFHPDDIHYAVNNRADVTWYRNIQNAPLYRRDLDIVAVAGDGAIASFCTVWFDDVTRSGVFEPVATVPAHQRRGLAKAVMCEGLRRLTRIGATRAYVGSYSPEAGALYASVGFTDSDLLEVWERCW